MKKKMKRRTSSPGNRPAERTRRRVRLGSHVSIAGGVDRAVLTAREVGCEALQIFVKSSNQ